MHSYDVDVQMTMITSDWLVCVWICLRVCVCLCGVWCVCVGIAPIISVLFLHFGFVVSMRCNCVFLFCFFYLRDVCIPIYVSHREIHISCWFSFFVWTNRRYVYLYLFIRMRMVWCKRISSVWWSHTHANTYSRQVCLSISVWCAWQEKHWIFHLWFSIGSSLWQ